MCLYPIVKFACCDAQYKPTEELPIVKFCPRGHPDTIRRPFPGCDVREPHECNDFFRLPIKCPRHKLEWLNAMDLNAECQETDARLGEAGVGEELRFRYRDKMARAFEMVIKCTERMEAERLQAWKVKVFCTGAALELLGTAIVGSDARPLDYSVLEGLRKRLIRHINEEAGQLMEAAAQERRCTSAGEDVEEESIQESEDTTRTLTSSLYPSYSGGTSGCAMDISSSWDPIYDGIPVSTDTPPILETQSSTGALLSYQQTPRFLTSAPTQHNAFQPELPMMCPLVLTSPFASCRPSHAYLGEVSPTAMPLKTQVIPLFTPSTLNTSGASTSDRQTSGVSYLREQINSRVGGDELEEET
ncbi:hypothetical protein N657DRAFT_692172 [Parathielavia appendiculata]|uniref:Uncharacterized protein n=1 Tax=Parathielavia appendiculata TaxID=2587402 RepID=A0AAN6TX13_9PEZI|nr:hypothetical protein N657DRAFT_692172 [Parathielavia appendiculata]